MKINCPQCGADIPPVDESGFVKCEYCDTTLYIDLHQAAQHYYYPFKINRNLIKSLLSRWLTRWELNLLPSFSKISQVYFPFWQIAKGTKTLFVPAAATPIQEFNEMKMPGGDYHQYRIELESEYEVTEPDIFLEGVLETYQGELEEIGGKLITLLIHLPFYVVEYQYENGEYTAFIDGVQGDIYAEEIPPVSQLKMDSYFTAAMIVTILIFMTEFFLIPGFMKPLVIALLTSIPLHYILKYFLLQRDW